MSTRTILVVDDEPLIRWSLAERLTSDGYHVLEADTGAAALDALAGGVDLVLLDCKLPDTDGLSVLRAIKQFDARIPVILLTAYASCETAGQAMALGAWCVTSKPFHLSDVTTMLEQALDTTPIRGEVRATPERPRGGFAAAGNLDLEPAR